MDVKVFQSSALCTPGQSVELSGWLVDQSTGLFLLGDHFPENDEYEYRIKIAKFNIMYPILRQVPSLGGGNSLLFYRSRVAGVLDELGEVQVDQLAIEYCRGSDEFHAVDVSENIIVTLVREFGNYKFHRPGKATGDWLNEID